MAKPTLVAFVTTIANQDIVDNYKKYLSNPNVRVEDKLAYNWLESAVAPLFGGVARGGSEKLLPDIVINDSALLNLFSDKFNLEEGESLELETKFRRTAIAPSSIGLPVTVGNIAEQLTRTTTSIGASVVSESIRGSFKKGQLVAEITKLNASGGSGWFSLIKKKDPELFKAFYDKAKFLQISYKTGTSVTALNLFTPLNKFTSPPFEMNYSIGGKTVKLYLNNAFERQLLRSLQNVKPLALSSLEQLRKDFADISFGKRVKVSSGSNTITVAIPTGGSIPITKAKVNVDSAEQKLLSKRESKQAFISGVQWTALTQRRLGETMLRLGDPEPPELKERSGRFRSSVRVAANYRTMTLQYLYNPLYSSLKRYGYRPDLQIETSIREVAQSLYSQKFNIVRGSSTL